MFFYFIIITLCFSYTKGQYFFEEKCPNMDAMHDFNLEKFFGRWYELSRYEQSYEKHRECVYFDISRNTPKSIVLYNSGILLPDPSRSKVAIGIAVRSYPNETPLTAKFNVTFGNRPPNVSNFWIVDTDYENYAFVYGCVNMPDGYGSKRSAWVLSRKAVILRTSENEPIIKKMHKNMDKYFDRFKLRITLQDDEFCAINDVDGDVDEEYENEYI